MSTPPAESSQPLRPVRITDTQKPVHPNSLHRLMRINLEAVKNLEGTIQDEVGIDPVLLDLASLRLAQIHRRPGEIEKQKLGLIAQGASEEWLDQVENWRESASFSDREWIVLALTEEIFANPKKPVHKRLLEEARHHFKKEGLPSLLLAIMAINDRNHRLTHSATVKITLPQSQEPSQEHGISPHWQKVAHDLAQRVTTKDTKIFGS
ncbi:MAG TPA: carboxymuconolactone decarboxylase family protein [Candidatus Methylacidiphilales bacterium]|nr:carboxymuconolactone decarboxylase family protein [Candidatus Methylacidiphilales bacterium]